MRTLRREKKKKKLTAAYEELALIFYFYVTCIFLIIKGSLKFMSKRFHLSLLFEFLSCLGHHRVLNRVPWTKQYLLISYLLIFCFNSVYMSIPISQFIPPPPFPHLVFIICSLRRCLNFSFTNKIIYRIFLDSTYMC